jgi:hypothetical protein
MRDRQRPEDKKEMPKREQGRNAEWEENEEEEEGKGVLQCKGEGDEGRRFW